MLRIALLVLGAFLVINFIYMLRTRKSVLSRQGIGRSFMMSAFFMAALPAVMVEGVVKQVNSDLQKAEFCGSCHVMDPYVKSLAVDDDEPLSAVHHQNNYVDKERSCYVCHTSYSAFGGIKAKANGLKHVWAYYTGRIPDTLKTYTPYDNRDCLHCHGGAKKFLAVEDHRAEERFEERTRSGELRCLECHDVGHYLGD